LARRPEINGHFSFLVDYKFAQTAFGRAVDTEERGEARREKGVCQLPTIQDQRT